MVRARISPTASLQMGRYISIKISTALYLLFSVFATSSPYFDMSFYPRNSVKNWVRMRVLKKDEVRFILVS